MRIRIKKAVSAAAAAALTISAGTVHSVAESFALPESVSASLRSDRLSVSSEAPISFETPMFRKLIGQEIEELSDLSAIAKYGTIDEKVSLSGDTADIPVSFDMREQGTITSVKNQGAYGTCWTFSASASAETSMLEAEPWIDLSEWHTAYFPYTGGDQIDPGNVSSDDHLQLGGTIFVVANLWAQWIGPVAEEKMPYGDKDMLEDTRTMNELGESADYHLENAYMFDYDDDRTNYDEVNSLIKQFVLNGRAVDTSYCADGYSYATNSAYSALEPKDANHSVTIAGWDDDYTASNFDGNTGAWLCRNSWDTGFGDNGYFWISYADTSLCEFAVFEIEQGDNYSTNYQHDSFIPTQTMAADDDPDINQPSYMANIFTAEKDEQLEAVATYINYPGTEYEITIYTGLEDPSDPSSGTASSVTAGVSELTGYQTIELAENILLSEGEQFSVVVKLYCDETKFVLPLETCLLLEDDATGEIMSLSSYTSYDAICDYTGGNESFYSEDGAEWTDVISENYVYTEEEKNQVVDEVIAENEDMTETQIENYRALFEGKTMKVVMGNMSLKAFANPVDTVDFSHPSGNVPLDESVELSVKGGGDIHYSINGGAVQLYTEPIDVTEDIVIRATANGIDYTERSYTPAKAEFYDLGYFTSSKYTKGMDILYAERADASTYNVYLSGAEDSVKLFPVSQAEVYMDGVLVAKNQFTSPISLSYGLNTFTFELHQENCLDNIVTLNIYRNIVEINMEYEKVIFSEATLTAPDGTVLSSGDSVSEYAGQILIAEADGQTLEVKVPERAVVPEMELDYYNETLNFLPNETAEFAEYAIGTSPELWDYIPVTDRCIDGQNITSGMVMNKAFRIIPGETITMRIAPGNGMFASEPVIFEIPSPGAAPTESINYVLEDGVYQLEYSAELEYGVIFEPATETELAEMAQQFGYETDQYAELMMKRYGIDSHRELLSLLGAEWDTYFEIGADEQFEIAVRYYSSFDCFASQAEFAHLRDIVKGDIDFDGNINALDASLVLTYYAEVSTGKAPVLTDDEFYAGDYDSDGAVNALDASGILTYYAQKATENL